MISILCPVRPGSDYVEGFLQHLVANIGDKDYVEVVLGVTLGDKETPRVIEPFETTLNIRVIEIDKSLGRLAFHTWLTILSHVAKGWALVFLSDDIRPTGSKLDEAFKKLEDEHSDKPVIFYLNGVGAYPGMTKVWFDKFGWGPYYGVDTFLNNVTKLIPEYKVDVPGIDPKDLDGRTTRQVDYKPMEYPSDEFNAELQIYIGMIRENEIA